jgi:hypothetical protein
VEIHELERLGQRVRDLPVVPPRAGSLTLVRRDGNRLRRKRRVLATLVSFTLFTCLSVVFISTILHADTTLRVGETPGSGSHPERVTLAVIPSASLENGAFPNAGVSGTLIAKDGCVFMQLQNGPALVLWYPGTTVETSGDETYMRFRDGVVVWAAEHHGGRDRRTRPEGRPGSPGDRWA